MFYHVKSVDRIIYVPRYWLRRIYIPRAVRRLYFTQNSRISQIIFFSRGHFASVFEPTEFVASFATTAGAVFTKTSDTSLWVLRAKLRNSSSDSAHCMVKSVSSVDFVWDNIFHLMLINSSTDSNKMKHDAVVTIHPHHVSIRRPSCEAASGHRVKKCTVSKDKSCFIMWNQLIE